MKKTLILSIFLFIGSLFAFEMQAQKTSNWTKETPAEKEKRMAWWTNDRFGMMICWGIYALPARHEWIKNMENMNDKEYQKYFDIFNPDLYNPQEWAKKAKNAGMKYVVLTTKHHDGFCLWDSKHTDYKVTNTPYAKDVLKPFVDAFRAEGIRIGLYYSLIDWHHPHFTYDKLYPAKPADWQEQNKSRDMAKYRKYMKDQLTELLTQFGQIDELFLDYSYSGENGKGAEDWGSEDLLKHIRSLMPNIIVDNRLDLSDKAWGWDYVSPEQFMPNSWPTLNGEKVAWETCQTFSGSWGYHRDEYSWKSPHQLVTMLIETVSKGGNLLLNVGPTARGVFDSRANKSLDAIGEWMKYHDRSIYGCTEAPAEFEIPQNSFLTYNPKTKRLYIHILEWPFKSLHLKNYKGKFRYAQLLNDDSEIKFHSPPTTQGEGNHMTEYGEATDIILSLPVERPNVEVPVIELILE